MPALLRRFRAPVFRAALLRPPLREALFLRERFVATRRRPPFFDLTELFTDLFNVISPLRAAAFATSSSRRQ